MKRNTRGSISVYILLVLTLLVFVMGTASTYSYANMARSRSDSRAYSANNVAQAALEYGTAKAFADVQTSRGVFQARDVSCLDDLASIGTNVTAARFTISPTASTGRAWVTGTATVDGRSSSFRTYVKSKDVGIWNNAIFAGAGASGQAINGNVDIHGSVHLLGDGEPFTDMNANSRWDDAEAFTDTNRNGRWDAGEPYTDTDGNLAYSPAEPYNDVNSNNTYDPPLTLTDLNSAFSGNSGIQNNYQGLSVALENMVPAIPVINGMKTLNSEVRVKNGMIGLSGSASFRTGALDLTLSYKTTIDGSFVSGGYTGTRGASSVFSDNGTANGYDVGALGISFPLITGIGAQPYKDASGATWTTQKDFLDAKSMAVSITSVTASTAGFTFGPDAAGNSISFTPEGRRGNPPAKLTVNGIVRVPSSFQLGSKDTITYAGSGTLYSQGTISVDGDIVPAAGLVFPTTTRLGMIARNDLRLATGNGSSQLNLAGAFYAQGRIISAKQNQVMGTFVSSYYDLGTNVPSIYQVPTLPKNMPPGMPGDQPYVTLDTKSWRARKL